MKYNINELLEKKKALEEKIEEKLKIDGSTLTYGEEDIIDYSNPKNNRKIIPRERVDFITYRQEFYGIVEELAKVKTAIQKYNAKNVLGKIQERENIRSKIEYLKRIKPVLPTESKNAQRVTRQDKDGKSLEVIRTKYEPMFEKKEVEEELDRLAAKERKINTEIQKLNLNAEIDM